MRFIILCWNFILLIYYAISASEICGHKENLAELAVDYYYTTKESDDRDGMLDAVTMITEHLRYSLEPKMLKYLLEALEDWDELQSKEKENPSKLRKVAACEKGSELDSPPKPYSDLTNNKRRTPTLRISNPNKGASSRQPYMHF